MKLSNFFFLFILAFFLAINAIYSETKASIGLPQKCIDALTPHLSAVDMSLEDLQDKTKASEFKNNYINTPAWTKIRQACENKSLGAHNCNDCDKLCLGNCACFVTWCYYECPCK